MTKKKRNCCMDCIFFYQTKNGERGAVKGKCKILRPNEERTGSRTACRMFECGRMGNENRIA